MATWKKTTTTSLRAALCAFQACKEMDVTCEGNGNKMTALNVAARVLLMYGPLSAEAQNHPEHLTWARTEVIRVGIMTGVIPLEVASAD